MVRKHNNKEYNIAIQWLENIMQLTFYGETYTYKPTLSYVIISGYMQGVKKDRIMTDPFPKNMSLVKLPNTSYGFVLDLLIEISSEISRK